MDVPSNTTYQNIAVCYDQMFSCWGKNYQKESKKIKQIIQQYKHSQDNFLLDLGCGTGGHIFYLKKYFQIWGVDSSCEMLSIARQKFPEIEFRCMDMTEFIIDRKFDAVTCLFSAIAYVRTITRLNLTIASISRHLKPGGVVLIEPWFTPEDIEFHKNDALFGEQKGTKACRMRETTIKDKTAVVEEHIMISEDNKVRYFTSQHVFGLFSRQDFITAFEKAHLQVDYLDKGLTNRGLYIGIKKI